MANAGGFDENLQPAGDLGVIQAVGRHSIVGSCTFCRNFKVLIVSGGDWNSVCARLVLNQVKN